MNILITGGSSGLGRAIAEKLALEADDNIYISYRSNALMASELEAQYRNITAFHCDFAEAESVDAFLENMELLDIDVLVNNAHAKYVQQHFHKITPERFVEDFILNVLPALRITQKAIAGFRKKKFGKIINIISSAVVNKPPVGMSLYAAQKSYMLSMSKSWATEGIRFNITSNCVSPAFMKTGLTGDYDHRTVEQLQEQHPLGRLLDIDEVADTVAYLSKASQQINGTHIVMNAGTDLL